MTAMVQAPGGLATPVSGPTAAPLGRMLRSELRMVLRRPRTLIALGVLALVPVIAGIGLAVASGSAGGGGGQGPGQGIEAIVAGNGLVLPIFALFMSLQLLLPMMSAMWSADALAGEASSGGLRNLLVAPVGRARLLAIKAFGVATVSVVAAAVMTVTGLIAGLLLLGGDGLLTLSGTTLPVGASLGRIGLFAVLVVVQMLAVAAVALAISSFTEHPLVVLATSLGGLIVFNVLTVIPALDWLHPVLITESFGSLIDVLREPMPTGEITEGVLRAACYLAIGYSIALGRMLTKDG